MNQAMDKELRNMLNEISLKLSSLMDDYLFQLKEVIVKEAFKFKTENPDHEDQSK